MGKDRQTFEMPHRITYYEESANQRPTLRTYLNLGILASENQSSTMCVGQETMLPRHLGWVVTSYSGKIAEQAPKNGEEVIIGCKALAYNRLLGEREFWIRSTNGSDYARFRGLFVMFDIQKRKMVSIPEDLVEPFDMPQMLRLPKIERPAKFDATKADPSNHHYQVRFFDIDLNQHVNNAVYADWMLDPLGDDFMMQHRLSKFAIRYEHEVRYGQQIDSRYIQQSDSTTLHQIQVEGKAAATAQFDWQSIN